MATLERPCDIFSWSLQLFRRVWPLRTVATTKGRHGQRLRQDGLFALFFYICFSFSLILSLLMVCFNVFSHFSISSHLLPFPTLFRSLAVLILSGLGKHPTFGAAQVPAVGGFGSSAGFCRWTTSSQCKHLPNTHSNGTPTCLSGPMFGHL